MDINMNATKQMCQYCFDTIISILKKKPPPNLPQTIPNYKAPLFVTWHIKQSQNSVQQLRGCIGIFQAQKLSKNLQRYAMISAFQDTRFNPISFKQVPFLRVAVSLLVNFENGKKYLEWQVGKHGIIIDLDYKGFNYNATFLPEVAQEQGWDQQTTIKHLVRKAGFYGKLEIQVMEIISLTTYESSKQKLTFSQYQNMKKIKNAGSNLLNNHISKKEQQTLQQLQEQNKNDNQ